MKKILLAAFLLATFIVLVLKTGLFSYNALVPDIFSAIREPTHIEIEKGTVTVNGVSVADGTNLNEGDYIELGEATEASIVFFDNSVSRLAAGTKLTVTQAGGFDSKQSASHVKLNLNFGQIWSKVTKLVNSESTFEVSTSDVAAAVRGSAFDVAVSEGGNTAVMAVEHSLQLKKIKNSEAEKDETVAIVEGQKAVSQPRVRRATTADTPAVSENSVRFKVERITDAERETTWFQKNERADIIQEIKVRRKIERAQEDLIGSLPGDLGYTIKGLRDATLLTLASKPEKKAEVASKIAERKIIEAQVLMRRGDDETAELQLAAAQDLILRAASERDASTNAETKSKIDQEIARTIDNSKQMTNSTTAVDRDYATKEFVYQVEVTSASKENKETVKKDQYQYRIIEAYDLAKAGKEESAKKVMRALAEDIQTDFDKASEEKDISDANLEEVLVDPYLEATMRRIEQIESTDELFGTESGKLVPYKSSEASESELQNGKMIIPELSSAQEFGTEGFLSIPSLEQRVVEDVSEQAIILQNSVEISETEATTNSRQSWDNTMPVLNGKTSEIELTEVQAGQPTIQITENEPPELDSQATVVPTTLQEQAATTSSAGTPRLSSPVAVTSELNTESTTVTTKTTAGTPQVSAEDWLKQKTEATKAEKAASTSATSVETNNNEEDYFFGETHSVEIEITDTSSAAGSKFDPQTQAAVEQELDDAAENSHQAAGTGATQTERTSTSEADNGTLNSQREPVESTNTDTATTEDRSRADAQDIQNSTSNTSAEIDDEAFGATVLLDGTQIDLNREETDTTQKFEDGLDYGMSF
ncbi:MAG: FecR domain-containing protein [Candidatus Peribacteraceae bacterium]|nr:FecR domain-containing protein [Candidatus Peribacteraceae bacterium]